MENISDKRKEIISDLLDHYDNYEDKKEAIKDLDILRCEVLSEMYKNEEGILVLKDREYVEKFSRKKMFYSIASLSDEVNQGMNEGEINLVINNVLAKIDIWGCKVVSVQRIRDYIVETLEELGFARIKNRYEKVYFKNKG